MALFAEINISNTNLTGGSFTFDVYIKDCLENPEKIHEMEKSYKKQLRELHINSVNKFFNEI